MLEPVWSTCRSKSAQDCFQLCHLFLGNWYGPVYISFPPENGCCLQQRLQEIKAADGGLTDCILCLCLRRWGSAVADLNLCHCLCCPATQPFPLLGACGRAPGRLWVLGTGKSWGCIGGVVGGGRWRMEGKSKRDRHVLPVLTLQPSQNASDSLRSSSQPLAPVLSSPMPFLVYTSSPSIYFRSHWPLLIFLTPFTFPRKTKASARFCDPFPQALYTHLPPQNLVWILPVLLSSLSTASLLQSPLPTRSLS